MIKRTTLRVSVENLSQHPIHQCIYETSSVNYLEESLKRSDNNPVYPVVVVRKPDDSNSYLIIAGVNRYRAQVELGETEIDVILYDVMDIDDKDLKTLIIDLNKQRNKTGRELLKEFCHYVELYPEKRGKNGYNRYTLIGKEIGYTPEKVKTLTILNTFFKGEGDCVLESVFDPKGINTSNAEKIKKVVETHPEKFNSPETFKKIINRDYKYDRLNYVVENLDIEDDYEFPIGEKYLLREMTPDQFQKNLIDLGKVIVDKNNHNNSKTFSEIINDDYETENTYIVKGDNRTVNLVNKFGKKVRCIAGSPPYGNKRNNLSGLPKGYNGEQFANYLVSTYERYIDVLEDDGSVYVNIDDFKLKDGEMACSLEYFVIGMKKIGLHLVGRYTWIKNNPIPNSYNSKKMVNGFEMVYRFVKNPSNYFTNQLMLENGEVDENKLEIKQGCSNPNPDGTTTRGGNYIQTNLKKVRNTLDEMVCKQIIRGNVANPETYFLQAEDKKHNSTFPIYLISALILEGSEEGDLILDIWNGQGNTLDASLMLGRQYWGVEIDDNYYQQTCHRAELMEEYVQEYFNVIEPSLAA